MASPKLEKKQKDRADRNTIKHRPFCTETRVSFSRSLRPLLSTVGDRKTKHRSGFPPGWEKSFRQGWDGKTEEALLGIFLNWSSTPETTHSYKHNRPPSRPNFFLSSLVAKKRLSVSVPSRFFSQRFQGLKGLEDVS
jgi:hypothetical protein